MGKVDPVHVLATGRGMTIGPVIADVPAALEGNKLVVLGHIVLRVLGVDSPVAVSSAVVLVPEFIEGTAINRVVPVPTRWVQRIPKEGYAPRDVVLNLQVIKADIGL